MTNQPANKQRLDPLPPSDDEFWDGEVKVNRPQEVALCSNHRRGSLEGTGFVDNRDGTVSCRYCPWGAKLSGYVRVHQGRLIDLRALERS